MGIYVRNEPSEFSGGFLCGFFVRGVNFYTKMRNIGGMYVRDLLYFCSV